MKVLTRRDGGCQNGRSIFQTNVQETGGKQVVQDMNLYICVIQSPYTIFVYQDDKLYKEVEYKESIL